MPVPASQPLSAESSSIVTFAPGIVIPYSLQYGVSVERVLRKGTSASVTYTGTRGYVQFRSRDVNAPLPPLTGCARILRSASFARSNPQDRAQRLGTVHAQRANRATIDRLHPVHPE